MPIVSNTTPIISFLKINRMDILNKIFEQVIIPQAVYDEVTAKHLLSDEVNLFLQCDFIKTKPVKNEFAVNLLRKQLGLDLGESEAIVLAKDLDASYLLIDELKGRRIAEQSGFNIAGTVGIIIKAKNLRLVDKVKPLLDELISKKIRISTKLYTSVLSITNES